MLVTTDTLGRPILPKKPSAKSIARVLPALTAQIDHYLERARAAARDAEFGVAIRRMRHHVELRRWLEETAAKASASAVTPSAAAIDEGVETLGEADYALYVIKTRTPQQNAEREALQEVREWLVWANAVHPERRELGDDLAEVAHMERMARIAERTTA